MSLLSGILVNGVRRGVGSTASSVLGRAVGGGLSGGLGGGGQTATRQSGSNVIPTQPNPNDPIDLAGVDVTAAPAIPPSSAIGQIVGGVGVNSLASGSGNDTLQPNTVEGVEVTAEQGAADSTAPVDLGGVEVTGTRIPPPAQVPGVDPFTTGGQVLSSLPGNLDLTQPEEIRPAENPIGIEQVALLAPLAAAGLIATGSGLPAAGAITPPGGAGGLPFGVKPTDLVAGGLLATSLAAGAGGGGANSDALKDLAADQKELAGRLGGIAEAGFQGNIGSKGLNSIARMVRKAQAAIRQRYAAMGMSGSTAEGDDLNSAVESGVDLQFKIGQQMAQTGLNAVAALTGQSAQAYLQLLNAQTQKDTALGAALANFAAVVSK